VEDCLWCLITFKNKSNAPRFFALLQLFYIQFKIFSQMSLYIKLLHYQNDFLFITFFLLNRYFLLNRKKVWLFIFLLNRYFLWNREKFGFFTLFITSFIAGFIRIKNHRTRMAKWMNSESASLRSKLSV
jgi:hypothetical protein